MIWIAIHSGSQIRRAHEKRIVGIGIRLVHKLVDVCKGRIVLEIKVIFAVAVSMGIVDGREADDGAAAVMCKFSVIIGRADLVVLGNAIHHLVVDGSLEIGAPARSTAYDSADSPDTFNAGCGRAVVYACIRSPELSEDSARCEFSFY